MTAIRRVEHIASFCPECGINVRVDEDGCCAVCGATAMGAAVVGLERLYALAKQAVELRRRVRLARKHIDDRGWGRAAGLRDLLDLRKPLPKRGHR